MGVVARVGEFRRSFFGSLLGRKMRNRKMGLKLQTNAVLPKTNRVPYFFWNVSDVTVVSSVRNVMGSYLFFLLAAVDGEVPTISLRPVFLYFIRGGQSIDNSGRLREKRRSL